MMVAVFQVYTLSSVLTPIYLNDLTGSKVLEDEQILCSAITDKYFKSQIKLEKLSKYSSVQNK
jgi:hypothetical protein